MWKAGGTADAERQQILSPDIRCPDMKQKRFEKTIQAFEFDSRMRDSGRIYIDVTAASMDVSPGHQAGDRMLKNISSMEYLSLIPRYFVGR